MFFFWLVVVILAIILLAFIVHWAGGGVLNLRLGHFILNVGFAGSHVLIDGKLGEYSLHLGSGTVHRRPGGALCIVPVSPQHRGRLFLPFADDDPKTAEIMSKVLLLARDHEIKDPTILEQLHG